MSTIAIAIIWLIILYGLVWTGLKEWDRILIKNAKKNLLFKRRMVR